MGSANKTKKYKEVHARVAKSTRKLEDLHLGDAKNTRKYKELHFGIAKKNRILMSVMLNTKDLSFFVDFKM